jgi:hypothetical protein
MEQMQAIGEGLTFEKVWAAIQAANEQIKETDRQLNKRFGELTNRFGDMVEYMVLPNLVSRFEELALLLPKRTVPKLRTGNTIYSWKLTPCWKTASR